MSYVTKRPSDAARGRLGKFTCWYVDVDGRKRSKVGTTDRAESEKIAARLESEATQIREGTLDPVERARRQAALLSIADHVQAYREDLEAKGDTKNHAKETASMLIRILELASIESVADLAPDRIRAALSKLTNKAKKSPSPASARTKNKYAGALKSFATWLEDTNRIKEVPRGLSSIRPFNVKEDRKLVRRALTKVELDRLMVAAEQGDDFGDATGKQRAILYRLAMGTGFRANELRTLTPERFRLDGNEPSITLDPKNEKNRSGTVQPITRELAGQLKALLEGCAPGKPVLPVPDRTAVMLRRDLAVAKIPVADEDGRVVDFHALRVSYITHLIMSGVNPKIVQTLARHSTITLTLDCYTKVDREDVRKALEGE